MEDTVTIYSVQLTSLAIAQFKKRASGTVPMLNDNLGDRCHQVLDDAIVEALDIGKDLKEVTISVVHIFVARRLFEELVRTQQILSLGTDSHGKPVWQLSPAACRRLNTEARFLIDPYPLPLVVGDAADASVFLSSTKK